MKFMRWRMGDWKNLRHFIKSSCTPGRAVIKSFEMAAAYVGTCLMPPVFGPIANHISASLLPVYLLIILVLLMMMYEKLLRRAKHG